MIEIFYEKHLGQLIDVIVASCPSVTSHSSRKEMGSGRVKTQQRTKPEVLSNICELLCFCVLHHPYRIKYFFNTLTILIIYQYRMLVTYNFNTPVN